MIAQVRITPALFGLFQKFRLSTAAKGTRWEVGQAIALDAETQIEKYAQVIAGQRLPQALGAFSYSHSPLHTALRIGRYCSLSWGVDVIEGDHPMDWVTTSPVTHAPGDIRGLSVYLNDIGAQEYQLLPYGPSAAPVTLGHDVWIGMKVLIKRGVRIGHGAIVGAGSLVTRDVPPYAVVAGTPARILRYRFTDPLIERLLSAEWWRYGPDKIQPLDPRAPEAFLDRLEEAVADGLEPLILPVLAGSDIIAAGERI